MLCSFPGQFGTLGRVTDSEFTYLDARVKVARVLANLERPTGGLLS
jgi:hypothetical protein